MAGAALVAADGAAAPRNSPSEGSRASRGAAEADVDQEGMQVTFEGLRRGEAANGRAGTHPSSGLRTTTGSELECNQQTVLVAFDHVEYLCYENEGECEVTVLRRGCAEEEITVKWWTTNGTMSAQAYAGDRSGAATVRANERVARFSLAFEDNPVWNHEASFFCHLRVTSGNAEEGELRTTTIFVLNEDSYPYNAYGNVDWDVPFDRSSLHCLKPTRVEIVTKFVQQLWSVLGADMKWAIFFSLFPGLTTVAQSLILMFIMNDAIGREGQSGNRPLLFILVGCTVLNFALKHWGSENFRKLRLGGKAAQQLRTSVFDTMIQFTPASQNLLPPAKVTSCVNQDVEVAVSEVWLTFLKAVETFFLGLFQMVMFFYIILSRSGNGELEKEVVPLIIGLPFLMLLWNTFLLKLSHKKQAGLTEHSMEADAAWNKCSAENGEMRNIVTGYRKGAKVSKDFAVAHKHANDSHFEAKSTETHVMWASNWFSMLVSALLLLYLSDKVIKGQLLFGTMVALLSAVQVLGQCFKAVFEEMYQVAGGRPSIERIALILNADTRRKMLYRAKKRRDELVSARGGAAPLEGLGICPDTDALVLDGVSFKYPPRNEDPAMARPTLRGPAVAAARASAPAGSPYIAAPFDSAELVISELTKRVHGGRMVLFRHQSMANAKQTTGALGSKKSRGAPTLLRLIARQYVPSRGYISYPGNWRIRFLDPEPQLFPRSLWYNLIFGVQHVDEAGDPIHTPDEVCALCEEIGLGGEWAEDHLESEMGYAGKLVNQSVRILINLARALLSGAQLLLITNSLDPLGTHGAAKAIDTLLRMVRDRGLRCLETEYSMTPFELKKPRTVIISTRIPELHSLIHGEALRMEKESGCEVVEMLDIAENLQTGSSRGGSPRSPASSLRSMRSGVQGGWFKSPQSPAQKSGRASGWFIDGSTAGGPQITIQGPTQQPTVNEPFGILRSS